MLTPRTTTTRSASSSTDERLTQIMNELRTCGFTTWGLIYAECRVLPSLLHEDEHIDAAMHGRGADGRALFVATDQRLLYIDKKLLFLNIEEISYDMVIGESYHQGALSATLIIHTRTGDYTLHTRNIHCAETLRDVLELKILTNSRERTTP